MKKTTSIIIIVVCLLATVMIFSKSFLSSDTGGIDEVSGKNTTWVKCKNCQAEYQMNLKEFYKAVEANIDPKMAIVTPGIKCEKCGNNTVYQAVKCPKCETVFFLGSVRGQTDDTCPKCGFSATEEARKNR